jgi:hypothetical protein
MLLSYLLIVNKTLLRELRNTLYMCFNCPTPVLLKYVDWFLLPQEKFLFFLFVGISLADILIFEVYLVLSNGFTNWIHFYSSLWEKMNGLKLPYPDSSPTIHWICELSVVVQLMHWNLFYWAAVLGTSYFVLFIFYKMASEVSVTLKRNPNLSLEDVTRFINTY